MTRQPWTDLAGVLQQLVGEHRKLLQQLDAQQVAMKAFDLNEMDASVQQQQATRLRILSLETRRRGLVLALARSAKLTTEPTIAELVDALPASASDLLPLREALREVVMQVSHRSKVAGKLAGAVLGHLNTVVRLIAGAAEQAGVYTKQGVPQVAGRIGVLEAVA